MGLREESETDMPCIFEHPVSHKKDCAFAVCEDALIAFEGQTWCVYHLPMGGWGKTPSLKAGYGAEAIGDFNARLFACIDEKLMRDAQVAPGGSGLDLSGVVFPGPVSFADRTLPAVRFDEAEFNGGAYFSGAYFSGAVSFVDTRFADFAYFSEVSFNGGAVFNGAHFDGITSFLDAQFAQEARFAGAYFGDFASFSEAGFAGLADLAGARFADDASFAQARFSRSATFNNASFGKDAVFESAGFSGEALFAKAQFGRDALFVDTCFGAYADFTDAHYCGNADYSVTLQGDLPTDVTAQNCSFQGVSFVGADFGRTTTFSNRPFAARSDFTRCDFIVLPVLRGCTFYDAIALPDAAAI